MTIVLYDDLIRGVHEGELFDEYEFTLLDYDPSSNIFEAKYQGVCFMVDNGYLVWSTAIPPMKHAATYKCICFSKWLESNWKYVECTFGIHKSRFFILRYGNRIRIIERCDQTWKTCYALHNMLLFINYLENIEIQVDALNRKTSNSKH